MMQDTQYRDFEAQEWTQQLAVDVPVIHETLGSGVIFSRSYERGGDAWVVAFDDGSFAIVPASELS